LGQFYVQARDEIQPRTDEGICSCHGRSRFPVWLLAALLVLVTMALYWPASAIVTLSTTMIRRM